MRPGFPALLAASMLLSGGQQADIDRILERAAAYVNEYQQQLTAIVADEIYTQRVRAQVPLDKGMPPTRTTTSEIFFLYVPGDDWMAMRDVALMDGQPVLNRPDLTTALRTLPASAVARQFKEYNSRFNLGRAIRNFNEPTLSLLVLDGRHRWRFHFDWGRMERSGGETLFVVGFREVTKPTLIRGLDGSAVFTAGEFAIEPSTGRVRRARMTMTIGTLQMAFATSYEPDRKLGMLVPKLFRETYQDGVDPRRASSVDVASTEPYELIVCEAKYRNFRRFEVKAIVR
jgi:hypothetical protein